MNKRMWCAVMAAAAIAGLVQGAELQRNWNPAANPHNDPNIPYAWWTDPNNWAGGSVPEGGPNNELGDADHYKVQFYNNNAKDCYLATRKMVGHLVVGDGGVNPGILHLLAGAEMYAGYRPDGSKTWTGCGFSGQGAGIVVHEGALLDCLDHLWIAHNDNASGGLVVDGGTVVVHQMFGMNFDGKTTTSGYCQVKNGGLLHLMNWNNSQSIQGNMNLDIEKGTVIIRYWRLDLTNPCDPGVCAQDGRITGYKNAKFDKKINVEGGDVNNAQNDIINNVVFTWDAANNQTILTAVHPMQPAPDIDEIIPIGDVTFEWNNWEPNMPGESVSVEILIGTDPEAMSVAATLDVTGQARSSTVLTISAPGTYYWRVDTNNGAYHEGDVFTFEATANLPPKVDAGSGFITWVGQPVQLDATVTDENIPMLTWTVEPDDGMVSFSDNHIEDPVVTAAAEGTYTLTLTADDGFNPVVRDTTILDVYADSCAAARRNGTGTVYSTDVVADCVIDLEDLAEVASDWLVDYNLTGPIVR